LVDYFYPGDIPEYVYLRELYAQNPFVYAGLAIDIDDSIAIQSIASLNPAIGQQFFTLHEALNLDPHDPDACEKFNDALALFNVPVILPRFAGLHVDPVPDQNFRRFLNLDQANYNVFNESNQAFRFF